MRWPNATFGAEDGPPATTRAGAKPTPTAHIQRRQNRTSASVCGTVVIVPAGDGIRRPALLHLRNRRVVPTVRQVQHGYRYVAHGASWWSNKPRKPSARL